MLLPPSTAPKMPHKYQLFLSIPIELDATALFIGILNQIQNTERLAKEEILHENECAPLSDLLSSYMPFLPVLYLRSKGELSEHVSYPAKRVIKALKQYSMKNYSHLKLTT